MALRAMTSSGPVSVTYSSSTRRAPQLALASVSLLLLVAGCSTIGRVGEHPLGAPGTPQVGNASWYGGRHQGLRTASGERYDEYAMTAASPYLPLGTRARIKNLENGRSVIVRVNDRGPFVEGRIIDVSYAAARALGMVGDGVVRVKVVPLR